MSPKYSEFVDWLMENDITGERQWLMEDKESYRHFQATSSTSHQIKAAIENARAEMVLTKSAKDSLMGILPVGDITIKFFNFFKLINITFFMQQTY